MPLRTRLAVASIGVVAVGWPVTAALQALGYPVFEQVMLGLSWLAPAYTAVDMLMTAQLHRRTHSGGRVPRTRRGTRLRTRTGR